MSSYVDGPVRTFTSAAALSPHLRVKLSSGKVALSGSEDEDIGTVEKRCHAANELVPIRLRTAQGTRKVVAAGSFALGATLYKAANGQVDDSGTHAIGTALEASTGAGDVVEMLPLNTAVTVIEIEEGGTE